MSNTVTSPQPLIWLTIILVVTTVAAAALAVWQWRLARRRHQALHDLVAMFGRFGPDELPTIGEAYNVGYSDGKVRGRRDERRARLEAAEATRSARTPAEGGDVR
ncbi:hypothetical protein CLV30_13812 [Haloactinopolyspora alba]|uniref:Uncharacterized protein n=1 Tax=Haloactinopolyspora alba TaxID=648780 RepID=A0A2P8D071_9ACTN|nr:hypothetical protein [Haloactinopolyspora alba]PSK90587.1 hypothetical protein CLV30_13812 [Haloactinopolyspora alba]